MTNPDAAPLFVSVLIPVRDETLNLDVMLRILVSVLEGISAEILVIYDRDDDLSVAVVERGSARHPKVRGVLNTHGKGVDKAIGAGVEAARGEWIVIFAADEVGPVVALDHMLHLARQGCRFISCTRYAHGGKRLGGSWIGHLLSSTANRLLRLFSGMALSDATTGIKMFRREDFPDLLSGLGNVGWSFALEMSINAQRLGYPLGEIPIVSVDRLFGGKSTFRLLPWITGYWPCFVMALRVLPRAKRPHLMYMGDHDRIISHFSRPLE